MSDPHRNDPYASYSVEEAAHLLSVAPRTIQKWVHLKIGPVPWHVNGRLLRFTRQRLIEFIEAKERWGSWQAKARDLEARVKELEAEVEELRHAAGMRTAREEAGDVTA